MRLLRKLRSLFRKGKLEADMAEEMRFHLDQRAADNAADGLSAAEARYAAQRRFGNVASIQEQAREDRGWVWLEQWSRDLRFALRQLAKSPGFAAVSILSLALGIGAGTAVFSVANAVLLRSLPVPDPHELRVLHWAGTKPRIPSWTGGDTAFTPPHFLQLREQGSALADIFGFIPVTDLIARGRGEAFSARGLMVSDNFFTALGVRPVIGRALMPGEDYAGAGASVVISYDWWERIFSLDPAVVGQVLALNGRVFTITGVAPRGFSGPQPGEPSDFFVPLAMQSPFLYREITSNAHWYVRIMGRLRSGATDRGLKAALDVAWAGAATEFMQEPRIHLTAGGRGEAAGRDDFRRPLLLLLGVVGLIMLVACANLAGLSLARSAARQHELAVRAALGAGRGRLIRQSLTESLLLALLGGCGGVLLAGWLRAGIAQLLGGSRTDLHYDYSLDLQVLGFTFGLALLVALLAGLLPALRAGRVNPVDGLKNRGTVGVPRLRAGRALVTVQLGLSLLLLTGAGLYVRTLFKVAAIDAGFPTEKLLLLRLNIRGSASAEAEPGLFYGRVQEALAALPGVRAVSLVEFPLLSGESSSGGSMAGTGISTRRLSVGETFFETMGIPVLRGRGFLAADGAAAPKVIVVNEAFVRRYAAERDPIGLTVTMWEADWQIVGVCRDVKYNSIKAMVPPTAYFPFRQRFYSRFKSSHLRAPYFAVRTTLPPLALAPVVRSALQSMDPDVAVTALTTQEEVGIRAIGQERLFAILCGTLGGLALLLACIGLYGLMAYNVTRRTGEFGIRMALGAQPADIARAVMWDALRLAGAGVALGLPAALALTHLIKNQLFGIQPNDALTLLVVAAVLVAVTLLAAWLPARRAARINPLAALRAE